MFSRKCAKTVQHFWRKRVAFKVHKVNQETGMISAQTNRKIVIPNNPKSLRVLATCEDCGTCCLLPAKGNVESWLVYTPVSSSNPRHTFPSLVWTHVWEQHPYKLPNPTDSFDSFGIQICSGTPQAEPSCAVSSSSTFELARQLIQ